MSTRKKICLLILGALATAGIVAGMVWYVKSYDRIHANHTFDALRESVNGTDGGRKTQDEGFGKKTENPVLETVQGEKDIEVKQSTEQETEQEPQESQEPAVPERDILAELGIEVPEKNLDWDELKKLNADIYAWIYVPDTTVDYPVLQHPKDNTYYLNYNLDGSKGFPGCIYTENFNKKDFTDPNTVIYGHNLKERTMFSTLHKFEDKNFAKEDHYFYIYTEEKTFVYQVFGAYIFSNDHLLLNYDLSNEYVYEQYLKDIYKLKTTSSRVANIRDDIEVTKEDRIVTLSTCTRESNPDYRFLVVGVLLNP